MNDLLVLRRWQARLAARLLLLARARRRHDAAAIAERQRQVDYARRVVDRHSHPPVRPPVRTSDLGLALLRAREGCVLRAYNDSVGNATIGVGHLLHMGPVRSSDPQAIIMSQAMAMLRRDVRVAEQAIAAHVRVRLTQGQFDALVSLIFNIGTGGFQRSTVLAQLNERHYVAAANAFMLWDQPPELVGRRRSERAQFLAATG